jgi:hypothetical protein
MRKLLVEAEVGGSEARVDAMEWRNGKGARVKAP